MTADFVHYTPGEMVDARDPVSGQWRLARIMRDAPYPRAKIGGAYAAWAGPTEQWESSGGWFSSNSLRRFPADLHPQRWSAISDALADAETLYRVAADESIHCYGGAWDGPLCDGCNDAVRALRAMGEAEADARLAVMESGRWGRIQVAYAEAAASARAAFRAVPGLRGDA